jgi:hypothetical protein
MISILLVAAIAACIVYIVSSSESVDHQCGVDLKYHNSKKGNK